MSMGKRPWPWFVAAVSFYGILMGSLVVVLADGAPSAARRLVWISATAGPVLLIAACYAILRRVNREGELRNKHLADTVLSLEDDVRAGARELDAARRATHTANTAKSSFLTNMSHEFRTPMNAIIGFSEVLSDQTHGPLNAAQLEYVGHILESGRHLLELLSDILDLSEVDAGKVALEFSTFLVGDLLESCANLHRGRADERRIRLEVDASPDAPVRMEGDERRLRQVLGNLLSNSIKFTPEGGTVRVVAGRAGRRGPSGAEEGITISVSDNGIGIRQEDLPRLFKEFSQLENPYTKSHEGTGLGLAMAKRIVDLHGGAIGVESVFGQGSTFTFTLPLRQTPAAAPGTPPSTGPAGRTADNDLTVQGTR